MSDHLWGNTRPLSSSISSSIQPLSSAIIAGVIRYASTTVAVSAICQSICHRRHPIPLGAIFCFVFISTPQYIPAKYDPDPKSFLVPKHLYPPLSLSINGKEKIYTSLQCRGSYPTGIQLRCISEAVWDHRGPTEFSDRNWVPGCALSTSCCIEMRRIARPIYQLECWIAV